MLQLMRKGCSYTYLPLSIARYSYIQLSELEQCRVKKRAKGFNTAAEDLNLGSSSQESEALPLSHCAQSDINHRSIDWELKVSSTYARLISYITHTSHN